MCARQKNRKNFSSKGKDHGLNPVLNPSAFNASIATVRDVYKKGRGGGISEMLNNLCLAWLETKNWRSEHYYLIINIF